MENVRRNDVKIGQYLVFDLSICKKFICKRISVKGFSFILFSMSLKSFDAVGNVLSNYNFLTRWSRRKMPDTPTHTHTPTPHPHPHPHTHIHTHTHTHTHTPINTLKQRSWMLSSCLYRRFLSTRKAHKKLMRKRPRVMIFRIA